eukprot:scaffold3449_cov339-Prasinococcus_capsulatus_cf.AAC.7
MRRGHVRESHRARVKGRQREGLSLLAVGRMHAVRPRAAIGGLAVVVLGVACVVHGSTAPHCPLSRHCRCRGKAWGPQVHRWWRPMRCGLG